MNKEHAPATQPDATASEPDSGQDPNQERPQRPKELGGPKGPEPTRYGDWERNGRCSDF